MGNRWTYIPPMIVAIIDVTIDMYLQRVSTCVIENEPNIMIFPQEHFNKGHLHLPAGLFKDTYACSQLNSCKCKMLRESAEYPANEIRRPERASRGPRSCQSGATNSGVARVTCGEKAPFFPREPDAAHTCVRVSPRPRLSYLLFFSFRGKKSRCGAVNQSPRDRGERTNARKSHGGPGLMPVRLAC